MKKIYLCCVVMLFAGCASYSRPLTATEKSGILDAEHGIIVTVLKPRGIPCSTAVLTFKNVDTGDQFSEGLLVVSWTPEKNFDTLSVPAGLYVPVQGKCMSDVPSGNYVYQETKSFRFMALSYEPFRVEAGQAVYPGSFVVKRPQISGANYFLFSTKKYGPLQYKIEDHTDVIKKAFAKKYPELAHTFVSSVTGLRPGKQDVDIARKTTYRQNGHMPAGQK